MQVEPGFMFPSGHMMPHMHMAAMQGDQKGLCMPEFTGMMSLSMPQGSMYENIDFMGQKHILVAPRKKSNAKAKASPLALNLTNMRPYFHLTQQMACDELGICLSTLKKICRKLGIKRWPGYQMTTAEIDELCAQAAASTAHEAITQPHYPAMAHATQPVFNPTPIIKAAHSAHQMQPVQPVAAPQPAAAPRPQEPAAAPAEAHKPAAAQKCTANQPSWDMFDMPAVDFDVPSLEFDIHVAPQNKVQAHESAPAAAAAAGAPVHQQDDLGFKAGSSSCFQEESNWVDEMPALDASLFSSKPKDKGQEAGAGKDQWVDDVPPLDASLFIHNKQAKDKTMEFLDYVGTGVQLLCKKAPAPAPAPRLPSAQLGWTALPTSSFSAPSAWMDGFDEDTEDC